MFPEFKYNYCQGSTQLGFNPISKKEQYLNTTIVKVQQLIMTML